MRHDDSKRILGRKDDVHRKKKKNTRRGISGRSGRSGKDRFGNQDGIMTKDGTRVIVWGYQQRERRRFIRRTKKGNILGRPGKNYNESNYKRPREIAEKQVRKTGVKQGGWPVEE